MCEPASFVVTKDKVFWSKKTDSHEEIIAEFGLVAELTGRILLVRCEVTPPDGDFNADPAAWMYKTDQAGDRLPDWFDQAEVAGRCRSALPAWITARVVKRGEICAEVSTGMSVFVSGRVECVTGSGRVERVTGSGRVERVTDSGSVGCVTGSGSVGCVTGSATVSFYRRFTVKVTGSWAVIINRIHDVAQCVVGTEYEQTVTGE